MNTYSPRTHLKQNEGKKVVVSRGVVRGIAGTPPAILAGSRFSDTRGGVRNEKPKETRRGSSFPVAFRSVTRDPQNSRLAACHSGD